MSYQVILMPRAEGDLNALPLPLQQFVENHLVRLGHAPATLSRPSVSPPYPPGGMISEFDFEDGDTLHHFAVFFVYSQDETKLFVTGIAHSELTRSPSSSGDIFPILRQLLVRAHSRLRHGNDANTDPMRADFCGIVERCAKMLV